MDNILSSLPVNDPFYPGYNTAAEQAEARASKEWPLVTGIRALCGNKVWCAFERPIGHLNPALHLVAANGTRIFSVSHAFDNKTNERIAVVSAHTSPIHHSAPTVLVESTNISYALNRLAAGTRTGKKRRLKKGLDSVLKEDETLVQFVDRISAALCSQIDSVAYTNIRESSYHRMGTVRFPSMSQTVAADVLGALTMNTPITRQDALDTLDHFRAFVTKRSQMVKETEEAWANERWVLMTMPGAGVVVGAFKLRPDYSGSPLSDFTPYERHIDHTVPLRLYKSLNHLPPEIADAVKASLVMEKTMNPDMFRVSQFTCTQDADPDYLIPRVDSLPNDMSYTSYAPSQTAATAAHFYMVGKL